MINVTDIIVKRIEKRKKLYMNIDENLRSNNRYFLKYLKWDTDFFKIKSAKLVLKNEILNKDIERIKRKIKQEQYEFITVVNENNNINNNKLIYRLGNVFLADVNIQFKKYIRTTESIKKSNYQEFYTNENAFVIKNVSRSFLNDNKNNSIKKNSNNNQNYNSEIRKITNNNEFKESCYNNQKNNNENKKSGYNNNTIYNNITNINDRSNRIYTVGTKEKIIIKNNLELKEEILEISQKEFKCSRFIEDDNLIKPNEVYLEWSKNSFGRKDKYFAYYEKDNRIEGFILFSINSSTLDIIIELIAIKNEMQSKGVGSFLLKSIEEYAKKNSIKFLRVGTQLNNIKAQNFYIKNGFKHISNNSIYHLWR